MSKGVKSDKSSKKAAPSVLSKVKDAGVTKPAQSVKSKTKEVAKKVAAKDEKKSKKSKKAKSPTPSSSESESEDEEMEDASSSDSESEVEAPKAKVAAKAAESSDDSDSDSDSESEAEAPAPKAAAAAKADSSDDSDSSESESEDEAPKTAAKADAESSDSDSDSDSSASDSEEVPEPKKRKAEEEAEPVAKKSKFEPVVPEGASAPAGETGNLFVGNLSWNIDEEWLTREFEEFGEISGVRIVTDRDSGRSKGFGYVEFVNNADAIKAHAAKKGSELDGRELNVDFANARKNDGGADRSQNRANKFGDQRSPASDTLFVGNLSFDATQDQVQEVFADYGTILGVRLPTDVNTGNPKGFGYVQFGSVDEAKAALEACQGWEVAGRGMRLDFSTPRQPGDAPRGGGRGRGGDRGRGGRGGRGGFGDRGGRGGRGGFGGRGGRGGAPSTNRGGFGDFQGKKMTF